MKKFINRVEYLRIFHTMHPHGQVFCAPAHGDVFLNPMWVEKHDNKVETIELAIVSTITMLIVANIPLIAVLFAMA